MLNKKVNKTGDTIVSMSNYFVVWCLLKYENQYKVTQIGFNFYAGENKVKILYHIASDKYFWYERHNESSKQECGAKNVE